jgi:hypothetical protein
MARMKNLAVLMVLVVSAAWAQDQDAAAKANEQKARAALNAMVQALGGDRWLTLTDSTLIGRTSGFYQGKPTGDIMDYWDYRRFPDKERIELTKKRDWLEIVNGNEVWEVTYRGKKAIPKEQADDLIRRRDHSIEVAIKVWLKDPKTVLLYEGQTMVERHLADQVTLISATNDSITIQMGTQDHLPLRRSFQWRDPLYKDKNEDSEEYDDYHSIEGIPTPFAITRFHNGDMTNQRFLYKASYNSNLEDSMFDADDAAQKIKK